MFSDDTSRGPLNMTHTIDLVKDLIANYEKIATSNDTIFKLMERNPGKMEEIGEAVGSLIGTMTKMTQSEDFK